MWLKVKGFVEKIQQWWNGYHFIVSASFIATKKLKALKEDLKKWNKEFGDLAFRNKSLSTELMGLDAREESQGLLHQEKICRTQLKGEIK